MKITSKTVLQVAKIMGASIEQAVNAYVKNILGVVDDDTEAACNNIIVPNFQSWFSKLSFHIQPIDESTEMQSSSRDNA